MKIMINNIEYQIKEMSQKDYKEFKKKEDEDAGSEITDTTKGIWYGASHHYQNIIFLVKKGVTLYERLSTCTGRYCV